MAIDNSWLGLYWETGLLAVAIVAIALIVAWVSVLRAPTPYVRATAETTTMSQSCTPTMPKRTRPPNTTGAPDRGRGLPAK